MAMLLRLGASLFALLLVQPQARAADDYAVMLGYLADSRIDGRALAGADGAIAVNIAAGDLNLQANLRSLANGDRSSARVSSVQLQAGNRFDSPLQADARIAGHALEGASGIASINQVSGSGNVEYNAVAASLAAQGIRETSDASLASFASAAEQGVANDGRSEGTRSVAVESTALHGFEGVLQLNQIAGAGNAAGNQLQLSVQAGP